MLHHRYLSGVAILKACGEAVVVVGTKLHRSLAAKDGDFVETHTAFVTAEINHTLTNVTSCRFRVGVENNRRIVGFNYRMQIVYIIVSNQIFGIIKGVFIV